MKRLVLYIAFTFVLLVSFCSYPVAAQENQPTWELYFSPQGGCTEAIIKELDKAKTSILVQAYSFTSAPIAKALLNGHKRGVKVAVILDKSQIGAEVNYPAAELRGIKIQNIVALVAGTLYSGV
jgi:phosphatidylserine/phosphatidylglycerophosphate/cardiolipin synthase-like enzyme